LIAVLLLTGCATMDRMADEERRSYSVTLTGNPETVRPCVRMGSVAVGDYMNEFAGGPRSQADIPRWLRVKAVQFGGDTVLSTGSGASTIGEIYKCKP
jgi:hypothetical protein